ncbi:MAG: hypothetical protein N2Z82_06980 [Thermomicrobium sp.]|nr:hypothetical protein [Thermomicrobium sp.]
MQERRDERLAHELAHRFRVLAGALDRLDRLEGDRAFAGWLDRLLERPESVREASEAMLRQVLRVASDAAALGLLRQLHPEEATPLSSLGRDTGTERVALHLQLGELAQAGLVILELESEAVRLTPLGEAVRDWFETLVGSLETWIMEWLELVRSSR